MLAGFQEEQQRLAELRLQEEQAKKAKEAAAASKVLNVTVDVQVRPVPELGGALPHSPFAYKLKLCWSLKRGQVTTSLSVFSPFSFW